MITDYHASYYAHELSRVGGTGVDRLGRALFDACVDLNPHQIEAALFALRSPLSKGVLLADEVGLGKTIEAGLVLCQYWAERRRNILVISPCLAPEAVGAGALREFNLPSIVMDAKTYKDQQKLAFRTRSETGKSSFAPCTLPPAGRKNSKRLPGTLWLSTKPKTPQCLS
jgi:hypothetical protein